MNRQQLLNVGLLVAVFYGVLGTEVQCTTAEARPSLDSLQAQIDDLQAQLDGTPSVSPLLVFDATGVEIGIYLDGGSTGFLTIFHEPSETIFGVTSELLSLPGITLYFEDTACEGAPFAVGDQAYGGFLLNTFGLGFVAVENATLPTVRTMGSRLSEGGCFSQSSGEIPVVPVRLIADLGLTFPLPGPLYIAPAE